jgi:hypothetical protein
MLLEYDWSEDHPQSQSPFFGQFFGLMNNAGYEQHLDNLRQKDALTGAETTDISVRLGNYSASHFEGSAYDLTGWTVPDLINPDDVSWLPKR